MVGIPLEFIASTRDCNSDAPVRNPGTTIAALRLGRLLSALAIVLADGLGGDGWEKASDVLEQSPRIASSGSSIER